MYDAATTLPACLRSIQRQSEPSWQCVVVDDGSNDGSAAYVRRVARDDARFELVQQAHAGLVATLNYGLSFCRGGLVARMDADDLMHRDRLVAQRTALDADTTLSAVGCHVRLFPRHQLGPGWREYETWLNGIRSPEQVQVEALVECPLAHPTLMLRRDVLAAIGYRDVDWPEDYDLILRLLAAGHRLGVVPRRLMSWREHGRRLTHTDPRYRREAFPECKATFLCDDLLANCDRYILWGYGGTGRALSRALRRHGKHAAFVVDVHAGRLGNRINGAAVVGPDDLSGLPRLPLIASVAGSYPRNQIRAFVHAAGWVEGLNFVCAA